MKFARRHIISVHGLTILLIALLVGVGWPTNNATIAVMLGYTAGLAFDPMIIGVGLLIGAVIERWWVGLVACLVAAVLMHFLIVQIDELGFGGPQLETILPRTLGFMCWASISSLLRSIIGLRSRPIEAVGVSE